MTDRVHPSAKPTADGGGAPSFPATKSQLYGATRPTYRPQPYHRRSSSRGWCCSLCLCLILSLLFVLLLLVGAVTVVYFLYHPHRPSFSVTNLKLLHLKLTSSSTLDSEFELTLSATNPNKNIVFSYDPTSVSILSSGDDDIIAQGTIPSFRHLERNTTLLKASIASADEAVESDVALRLKGSVKRKSELAMKVKLETKVEAKMGPLRTPPVPVSVFCDGVAVTLPATDKPATSSAVNTECAVDVRFKVWKWTLG